MRLLALIFSIYILLLTSLPCAEMKDMNHAQNAPVSQRSSNHDNCGECSPFCTCNCCSTPMVCKIDLVDFEVSTIVRKHETNYPALFVTQRSGDIWQPPQLS